MSKLSFFCLVVILCLQSSYSQRWDPIFEPTSGQSANIGALHTWEDGATLGGHVHANLNSPSLLDGVGVRGSIPLGDGWSVGGHLSTRGSDSGGGIFFSKDFRRRRRRSISCISRCKVNCKTSHQCFKECLSYMCLL